MAVGFQVTFDAADPEALGRFWATVLGYIEQPPPDGFASWDAFLESIGMPEDQRDTGYAVVDPDGIGPRLFFQKVPEKKASKNRVHLDVNVGGRGLPETELLAILDGKARELVEAGATEERRMDEDGQYWIVMRDPEGNEFCLQ
jgi:hypothetical protein